MCKSHKNHEAQTKLGHEKNILIVQDIDGVCIPLVKDPLKREIDTRYIYAANKLSGELVVLTCGEFDGRRGVNRIIENKLKSIPLIKEKGLYLPGLAACGVEYQDKFGNISTPGLSEEEKIFLKGIPGKMKLLLIKSLCKYFPYLDNSDLESYADVAICDTQYTPTLNLNEILGLCEGNLDLIIKVQVMMKNIMNELLNSSKNSNLEESFHLHIMPNLGSDGNKELIKYATIEDIGSTDIQFIIKGAFKEAGLLLLLNHYVNNLIGTYPFGKDFNVRNAPRSINDLANLCEECIPHEIMPLLVGVGDTVTSHKKDSDNTYLRGGSDRGFLTLIQEIGKRFKKDNQVVFVNSNNKEVYRPSISKNGMKGVSDQEDDLKFNLVIEGGPSEYISWIEKLAILRENRLND